MLRRLMTAPQKDVAFTQVIRQPSPTNPNQKKTRVDVQLVRSEGCNHILCCSEQRIAGWAGYTRRFHLQWRALSRAVPASATAIGS